jgi:peptidoglycan/LPS O-acetylase OafA/YrhL
MGLIRFLLAASVLILHTTPIFGLTLVGGDVAVQAFYMISGFYMALVLSSKYETTTRKGYKIFITNRLLKLYPVYWITLAAIVTLGVISLLFLDSTYIFDYYITQKEILTPLNFIYFILSNLFIAGQDILFFVGYSINGYFFQSDYLNADISLHRFLFMKQAWTISLEIYFYLLVPFINRFNSKTLIITTSIIFALRFYVYAQGYSDLPWSYQFFPFELGFFVVGLLAYRYYKTNLMNKSKLLTTTVLIFLVFLTVVFQFIGQDSIIKKYIYLVIFASAIPYIFEATKSNKIDRIIGESSYPIYIAHGLITLILLVLLPNLGNKLGFVNLSISLLFAVLFNLIIFKYIENYRQKRIKKRNENSY